MAKVCFSKVHPVKTKTLRTFAILVFALFGTILGAPAQAQVPVALAPAVHIQFLDTTGKVLAGGQVFTYAAGTTTRQDTYTDSTGSIINAWPIPLDATGAPSNASGAQTGIWLSNQSYKFCAYNSAVVLQWCTDNVSSYQILTGIQNITLSPVTVDPTGAAGELGYRSDIPCFRGYTTFWDCFVRLTDVQTLTNKTLASPVITGTVAGGATYSSPALTTPSINGTTVSGPPATYLSLSNDITTGTTANTLTKMLGATAVITATTDTGGAVGITVSGAGKTGSATIQQNGSVSCVFDGSTTSGDYAQISSTVAGNCHDVGANYPSNGQVVGRVQVTGVGAGTYAIVLFGPEIKPVPQTVASANLTAQGANISSTPMFTPAANGFYRFSCYVVITQAATTSSTLPSCNVQYTDGDSSVSENVLVTGINTTNTVGTAATVGSLNQIPIFVKTGVSVSYSTVGYVTSGATPLQYAIHIRLEGPL